MILWSTGFDHPNTGIKMRRKPQLLSQNDLIPSIAGSKLRDLHSNRRGGFLIPDSVWT
jgi:hypothetical protein